MRRWIPVRPDALEHRVRRRPGRAGGGYPRGCDSNTAQGITDAGDYIFRVPLSDEKVIPVVVETVTATLTNKTAALLYATDDAFSTSSAEMMRVARRRTASRL